jgi:hypothetical protein
MKYIFFILLFCSVTVAHGQDEHTWCIRLNGKTRLKNAAENTDKNRILIRTADLEKKGSLQIHFHRSDTAMRRTVMVYDENSNGLKNWEEAKKYWKMSTAELKELFRSRSTLKFYFTEIPRDPEKAMVVRVRMVHLCTLELK